MNSQPISAPARPITHLGITGRTLPADGVGAKTAVAGISAWPKFCQHYETVELWFDMRPDAQLKLIWLLDYFRSHPKAAARLKLRLVDLEMIELRELGKWRPHMVDVTDRDLAIASATWQAYRASTPEACFALLRKDLSLLPLLKPVLLNLLEELPLASTGLGTSEMRMLEMIASGYGNVNPLFHFRSVRRTRVFNESELGYLLDGLAFGPRPAIAGLDDCARSGKKICGTGTKPSCGAVSR